MAGDSNGTLDRSLISSKSGAFRILK